MWSKAQVFGKVGAPAPEYHGGVFCSRGRKKVHELIGQLEKCLCGLKKREGHCRHCDLGCQKVLTSKRGCRRCNRASDRFDFADIRREEYYVFADEQTERQIEQIRYKAVMDSLPPWLKPNEGNE